MVATSVVPPPELLTVPLTDTVPHVNDDDIVRKRVETLFMEESCAVPTPVQVETLEPPASPLNADPSKFQSCNHTPPKFQYCDHTPPKPVTTPLEWVHSAVEDFFGPEDAEDCDELTFKP